MKMLLECEWDEKADGPERDNHFIFENNIYRK